MIPFADWFPLTVVGSTFTTLGVLKVYGFSRGIVGGAGKSAACRILGCCPTWSRQINLGMTALFFVIGLGCFGILVWTVLHVGKA
jgi:hypothetical protein